MELYYAMREVSGYSPHTVSLRYCSYAIRLINRGTHLRGGIFFVGTSMYAKLCRETVDIMTKQTKE